MKELIHTVRVKRALAALEKQSFSSRLWDKDPTVWRQAGDGAKVIANRLGWLSLPTTMTPRIVEIGEFAEGVRVAGFTHVVLIGMGGSSLSPEVSRMTFGTNAGYPDLTVLDSTVPESLLEIDRRVDLARTLFIVSTKSGTTVETLSAYRYFWDKLVSFKGKRACDNFVAITDLGSPLDIESKRRGFRRLFANIPDVGGRYSALSYFGLVPAAVIGVNVNRLLQTGKGMAEKCAPSVPIRENPGALLGVVLAEAALAGRDKLTLIASPEIADFACWVEQLVAESTGKNGAGIVPIEGEPVGEPEKYGDDRLFIYFRLETSSDTKLNSTVDALEEEGYHILRISLADKYDLGREYFRWEMATAVASALLGVNAFDEPNVKESNDNTNRLLAEFKASGNLADEQPVVKEGGISLFCDGAVKGAIEKTISGSKRDLRSYLTAYLDLFQPGNYFALMAFMHRTKEVDKLLQKVRACLRDAYGAATTAGYGPRFLHSTGQLHKGGPNRGLFIQFTADDAEDVAIPGESYGFSVLKRAQALGDEIALRSKGRPLIRLDLGKDAPSNLDKVAEIVHSALEDR